MVVQSQLYSSQYDQKNLSDQKLSLIRKNESITAETVILIDEYGVNRGEMPRDKALEYARSVSLDLIQVDYRRDGEKRIVTAKVGDFGKFSYDQKKKDKQKKQAQKSGGKGVKEIKLGYTTGNHDIQLKIEKIHELLNDGYHIKLIIKLKGRERAFKALAQQKLQSIINSIVQFAKPQFSEPKEDKYGFYQMLVPR